MRSRGFNSSSVKPAGLKCVNSVPAPSLAIATLARSFQPGILQGDLDGVTPLAVSDSTTEPALEELVAAGSAGLPAGDAVVNYGFGGAAIFCGVCRVFREIHPGDIAILAVSGADVHRVAFGVRENSDLIAAA